MKKISILAIAVALLLCLTGCPTQMSDVSWGGPAVGDIIGDMNGDGMVLTETGVPGEYQTASFKYANTMNAWGGGSGTINCKVRKEAGEWNGDYGVGTTPTIGGDFAKLSGGGNIVITGFEADSNYHFVVKSTKENGVEMKVVKE
jgi:hypothetical protein